MARVDDYIALIDDPDAPSLAPGDPSDEALLGLLVHLAYSDGVVHDDEMALLQRVRPDLDRAALVAWAQQESTRPFSPEQLAAGVKTPQERRNILRFAARMVCLDGDVAEEELDVLADLAEVLGLSPGAPQVVVNEIVARGGDIDRERIASALRNMLWRDLYPARDDLSAALAAVVPDDLAPVCTVSLADEQIAGLFFEGLAAQFDQGALWVRFDEIEAYTRVPVPGAAFHLHTRSGKHLSMSNPQLRDIGALLDFIYGRVSVAS